MVILFRPYLPEQTAPKSCDSSSGPESENSSDEAILQCRWTSCHQSFENLDMLSSHVAKEHANAGKGGIFYCGWSNCSRGDKGFNARYKMLVHVRTHTNEKPHQCYQCHKSFSRAENLKIHSRSHTGEKPYVCTFPGCGKAYSNSSDRFKHSRTHAVDKPYACKIPGCPKRYTDPSSLRKHIKTYKHFPIVHPDLEEPEKECQAVHNRIHQYENKPRIPTTGDICDQSSDTIPQVATPCHVNESCVWQSARPLQTSYDRPAVVDSVNRYTELEQPLDLRIGLHYD